MKIKFSIKTNNNSTVGKENPMELESITVWLQEGTATFTVKEAKVKGLYDPQDMEFIAEIKSETFVDPEDITGIKEFRLKSNIPGLKVIGVSDLIFDEIGNNKHVIVNGPRPEVVRLN